MQTKLLIYECEGTESEIREWFQTVNIAGVPLNEQELIVSQIEAEKAAVEANKNLAVIYQAKIKARIAELWGE